MAKFNSNNINCANIRKIELKQINSDGTESTNVLYFDIETNVQLTEREAQLCSNVESLQIICAVVCND